MINKFDGIDWVLSNGQRPFRYDVMFNFPPSLQQKLGIFANNGLDILCKEAKLPDVKINQNQIGIFGRTVNIPSTRELKNVTQMTFYVDESSFSRRAFEYWCLLCDSSGSSVENAPSKVGEATIGKAAGVVDGAVGALMESKGPRQKTGNYTKGELVIPKYSMKSGLTAKLLLNCQTYSGLVECTYEFYDVYPIGMSTTPFEDSSTDRIMEFTVDLAYSSFFFTP